MSLSYVKHRIALERRIVTMIAEDAVAQRFSVTIEDEEEIPVLRSTDAKSIVDHAMAYDYTTMHFKAGDRHTGAVCLVFGNDGFDCIADYTDNEETRGIIARAIAYAETAEASEVLL